VSLKPDTLDLHAPLPSLHVVPLPEATLAVHLPLLPISHILSAIWPNVRALTVSLINAVFSLVAATIRPLVLSLSIHLVVHPLAVILPSVKPLIHALPFHLVIDPVAGVEGAVGPVVRPHAVFLAVSKEAIKL